LSDRIAVGRVGKPHGINGSFFVEHGSEAPERFSVGTHLYVDGEPAKVVESKRAGGRPVIRLDSAPKRGASLEIDKAALPEAGPDEYYVFQLVGLDVSRVGGVRLGRVTHVETGVANDMFANAQVVSKGTAVKGTNVGATKEAGEPNHAGNAGGKSVWWTWTAPASGTVTIDTLGSDFDTLLGVYTGTDVNALTEVASNDDIGFVNLDSEVTFNAVAGTTYRIAVDGFNGAAGQIVLTVALSIPPVNDNFANATTVTGSSVSVTGLNVNATAETGEPNHAGNAAGHSVWWNWTAPANGVVTIDTEGSDFDTVLAVYTGNAVNSLTLADPGAQNDDVGAPVDLTSQVTFAVTAGTTYRIAVDNALLTFTGNIVLNIFLQ
jgi:ribosomal 30S subunit maturation factor RimM